ncbi:MAG: selenocysteine-specific translation elongation factor [Bacteroidales bacterium]|nr:selenocysteine-specific translation elongation factor [Bacteroidales bacterium]
MKHLIIGTAGHVDHGKTALIKALTGIDCDTHKQEKERGITINLGFSHLNLPSGESVGIIDVPGHKDLVRTMIAGAFGIDFVLMVIAADSGIMPQTIEHFNIIEMLGIKNGIIALSKVDLVDKETLELANLEVLEYLEGTTLENAPIVGVSSITGEGLDELIENIAKIITDVPEKEKGVLFRMYIDRIFNVKGIGCVVTGSVLNGETELGKELFLLPGNKKKAKIRSNERHGKSVNKIFCGDRAAINLSGLKIDDFKRGMVLSDKQIDETSMVDATLSLFDVNIKIGLWSNAIFHSGTADCIARIHLLDKEELKFQDTAIAQIHLDKPAILQNRDKFILRNTSNDLSIGGGTIIDICPLHHKRRTLKLIENLKDIVNATLNADKLSKVIEIELKKETQPVLVYDLTKKLNETEEKIIIECRKNIDKNIQVYKSGERYILIYSSIDKEFYNKIIDHLRLWHKKNPLLKNGLDTKEFAGKLGFTSGNTGKLYLEELLHKMSNDGIIKRVENTWVLKEHSIQPDIKTLKQLNWLEEVLKKYEMQKPVIADIESLALSNNINKDKLKMMLRYLVETNKIYFHDNDYLHTFVVDNCRKRLIRELNNKEDGINEKEFRLLINGTKKICQVLLGIYEKENIIIKKTFYIFITDKGKEWLNG